MDARCWCCPEHHSHPFRNCIALVDNRHRLHDKCRLQRWVITRNMEWCGAQIEVRGWISKQNGRLHMGIGHPAMLQRLP
jgi:hypothetical protein